MVNINGLSSAFPKNKVFQEEIKVLGRRLFSSKTNFKRMEKVYDNSGVKNVDFITFMFSKDKIFINSFNIAASPFL